jgi:hypothetical protein
MDEHETIAISETEHHSDARGLPAGIKHQEQHKENTLENNNDLHQVWIYTIALGGTLGTLVYPRHELPDTYINEHTLHRHGARVRITTVELRNDSREAFEKECHKFVDEIQKLL